MSNIVDKIDELYASKTPAEVEKFMIETRDEILAKDEQNSDDISVLIAVCNELGALYREQSRWSDSAYNFELALEKLEEFFGTKVTEQYAVVLLNVAGTYRHMRDFEKALSFYRDAFEILTGLHKDKSYEFASLLNNMSLTYEDMNDLNRALDYSTAAYEIIVSLEPGQSEEAISLMNMASLAIRMGDLNKASIFTNKAIDIYKSLDSTSGHYPAAVNLAAVIAFKQEHYEEALKGFELSAELTYKSFGENKDYASALVNIAMSLDKLGRKEEAKKTLDKAEEIKAGLK